MKFSAIIAIVIAVIALVFAFQNNDTVVVKLFEGEFTGSLALVIIAALLIGFIVCFIALVPGAVKSNYLLKKERKQNYDLHKKLEEESIHYEAPGLGAEGESNVELD